MVHQKEIFRKIGAIIVEINEQYQYLSENTAQLNDLELELFSANADFLSEHIKILRRINAGSSPLYSKEAIAEPVKPEQPASQMVSESSRREEVKAEPVIVQNQFKVSVPEPPVIEEPPAYQAAIIFEKDEPETLPAVQTEQAQIQEIPEPESVPSRVFEPKAEELIVPVIATAVHEEEVPASKNEQPAEVKAFEPVPHQPALTLNDIISAQKAQTIQTNSQFSSGASISDLKSAISLNDKLLFIKDLFNGYSLAYSEAIEILNRFDSLDIADTFLKANYAAKNNWASKQNATDKFYDILKRRYSK